MPGPDASSRTALAARRAVAAVPDDHPDRGSYQRSEQQGAERLANLGLLAAGLVHEFSNILTVITMQSELLLDDLPGLLSTPVGAGGHAIGEGVQAISRAAVQGAGLTRQLLRLTTPEAGGSGGDAVGDAVADVADTIRDLQPVLRCLRRGGVAVEVRIGDVPRVTVAPGPIEQLVLNLAINARDALSGPRPDESADPCILVALQRYTGPAPAESTSSAGAADDGAAPAAGTGSDPEWVVIEVVDNGFGMPPEVLARASEPFFSTKAADRGTGLGLSVVTNIAASLGGWADIRSAPDQGTTVRVGLPVQDCARGGEG